MKFETEIEPLEIDGKIYYSLNIINSMRAAGYIWQKIGDLHGASGRTTQMWHDSNKDTSDVFRDPITNDYIHPVGKRGRKKRENDPKSVVILPDYSLVTPPFEDVNGCLKDLKVLVKELWTTKDCYSEHVFNSIFEPLDDLITIIYKVKMIKC